MPRMKHHLRGPHGHGRHRARRGAVSMAILTLLDEQPMHGYELIGALEERSGGRWKPSPGSIYPALQRLESRGLITPVGDDEGSKRSYELTDDGREVAQRMSEGPAPWNMPELGRHGELRRAVAELTGPARQIGRFGSADQVSAAVAAIKEATSKLYQILADGPPEPNTGSDPEATTGSD